MKKTSMLVAMAMAALSAFGGVDTLLPKLAWVESRDGAARVGDGGRALGKFQIHQCVVTDVNRAKGMEYRWARMKAHDDEAEEVARAYLGIQAAAFRKREGRAPTDEELARIWNGGPLGYRKTATKPYWEMVRDADASRARAKARAARRAAKKKARR